MLVHSQHRRVTLVEIYSDNCIPTIQLHCGNLEAIHNYYTLYMKQLTEYIYLTSQIKTSVNKNRSVLFIGGSNGYEYP
jgi:hypothetical protein